VTGLPPAAEPGAPLPLMVDVRSAVAVVVNADHEAGRLVIRPATWPWCRIMIAPEVALELALHLVSRVADLSHGRRR
jgi:hypothetical protein